MRTSKARASGFEIFCFACIVVFIVVQWLPIYGAAKGSLTSLGDIGKPSVLPRSFEFRNYIEVWREVPLGMYFVNSLIYSIGGTFIALLAAIPASYGVSRFRFKGKSLYLFVILATQMVAVSTIIIPLFRMIIQLKMFDSRLTIILLCGTMPIPFAVWMLRTHVNMIPVEIEEAAMVDGCSRFQAIFRVILPLMKPGVAAAGLMSFLIAYKQFFLPLVLLNSRAKYPTMVGVYTLASMRLVPWHLVMAATIQVVIPPVVFFFLAQKYMVSGLASGSIK